MRTDGSGLATSSRVTPDGEFAGGSRCPGRFNVLNALGAWAAARALGVPAEASPRRCAGAGRVPGRFQPVDAGQPFDVLVDYAHKPDALENVLLAARELAGRPVIVVVGAGGDRDRGKRRSWARSPRALADVAIVTSDNPRSEDPEAIIDEIVAGHRRPAPEVERRRRPPRRDLPRDRARASPATWS